MARKMLRQTAVVVVLALVVAANGAHTLAQCPMKCLAQVNTIARKGRGQLPLTRVVIVPGNAEGVDLFLLMAGRSSEVLVPAVVPVAVDASAHNSLTKPASHRSLTLLGKAEGVTCLEIRRTCRRKIYLPGPGRFSRQVVPPALPKEVGGRDDAVPRRNVMVMLAGFLALGAVPDSGMGMAEIQAMGQSPVRLPAQTNIIARWGRGLPPAVSGVDFFGKARGVDLVLLMAGLVSTVQSLTAEASEIDTSAQDSPARPSLHCPLTLLRKPDWSTCHPIRRGVGKKANFPDLVALGDRSRSWRS